MFSSTCVQCAIHTRRRALGGLGGGGGGGGSEEDHATHKPSHRWVDESGARYRFTPLTGRSHLSYTGRQDLVSSGFVVGRSHTEETISYHSYQYLHMW